MKFLYNALISITLTTILMNEIHAEYDYFIEQAEEGIKYTCYGKNNQSTTTVYTNPGVYPTQFGQLKLDQKLNITLMSYQNTRECSQHAGTDYWRKYYNQHDRIQANPCKIKIKAENLSLEDFRAQDLEADVHSLTMSKKCEISSNSSVKSHLLQVLWGSTLKLSGMNYSFNQFVMNERATLHAMENFCLQATEFLNKGKIITEHDLHADIANAEILLGTIYANRIVLNVKDNVLTTTNIQNSSLYFNEFFSNREDLSTYYQTIHQDSWWGENAKPSFRYIVDTTYKQDRDHKILSYLPLLNPFSNKPPSYEEIREHVFKLSFDNFYHVLPYFENLESSDSVLHKHFEFLANTHRSNARESYIVHVLVNGEKMSFNSVENAFQFGEYVLKLRSAGQSPSGSLKDIAQMFANESPGKVGEFANSYFEVKDFRYNEDFIALRDALMENLLKQKFYNHDDMANRLSQDTGSLILVYANEIDNYWGIPFEQKEGFGWGTNRHGKLLMKIRDKINDRKGPLRVAPYQLFTNES